MRKSQQCSEELLHSQLSLGTLRHLVIPRCFFCCGRIECGTLCWGQFPHAFYQRRGKYRRPAHVAPPCPLPQVDLVKLRGTVGHITTVC